MTGETGELCPCPHRRVFTTQGDRRLGLASCTVWGDPRVRPSPLSGPSWPSLLRVLCVCVCVCDLTLQAGEGNLSLSLDCGSVTVFTSFS